MGDQGATFRLELQAPNGEVIPARHSSSRPTQLAYTPPSRERVAEAVKNCEAKYVANLGNNSNAGESPVGILLRAASRELYWDGITDRHKTIFTHGLLAEVFTKSRVLSSLCFESAESRGYSPDRCFCLIRGGGQPNELGEFGRVFALLLLCNMPQHIFRFFAHGLCDKAFPFTEGTEDGTIRSKTLDGSKEDLQLGWTSQCCESFVTQQYRIFLPYFSEGHQRFEKDTIMPWYDYHTRTTGSTSSTSASTAGGGSAPSGGHSDVSRVAIHDGYHNFNTVRGAPGSGHVLTFAIKKLRTTNEDVFNREVAMLRSLGGKRPHTVELLATFRYDGIYSLIFPWAECDLLAYWQRGLGQGMSGPLIIWAVSQCSGLVSALEWIHNPTTVLDPENNELFGRHGDIKPENILWYKQNSDGLHPLASGELVLSDFGLSSLNHKNTRSNIINGGILHTTTYAPPESVLPDNVISQSIDIWALGCVYLEFVTWIIGGPTLVGKFQSARLAPFLGSPIGNDIFWEVQEFENPGTGKSSYVTVVKPKVVEWIKDLRKNPEATRFTQDFLSIIEDHMLVIKKSDRAKAEKLIPMFNDLRKQCTRDATYYSAAQALTSHNPLFQPPVAQRLSIPALEAIGRGSVAIPRYSGRTPMGPPRGGATHLKP